MPYTIDWIVDARILYARAEGELTGQELKDATRELTRRVGQGHEPLHYIEDDRAFTGLENMSLVALQQALTGPDYAKFGWAIAIVPEKYETMSDILGKMAEVIGGINYVRVETVPEALDFLAEHDHSLPPPSEWELPLHAQ